MGALALLLADVARRVTPMRCGVGVLRALPMACVRVSGSVGRL
jgi:hypothetical protein